MLTNNVCASSAMTYILFPAEQRKSVVAAALMSGQQGGSPARADPDAHEGALPQTEAELQNHAGFTSLVLPWCASMHRTRMCVLQERWRSSSPAVLMLETEAGVLREQSLEGAALQPDAEKQGHAGFIPLRLPWCA